MNTTIEVLKQAREALVSESAAHITNKRRVPLKLSDAITALTAEIERLEKVEPVAFKHIPSGQYFDQVIACADQSDVLRLYDHPTPAVPFDEKFPFGPEVFVEDKPANLYIDKRLHPHTC